jgi:hypothetical protein
MIYIFQLLKTHRIRVRSDRVQERTEHIQDWSHLRSNNRIQGRSQREVISFKDVIRGEGIYCIWRKVIHSGMIVRSRLITFVKGGLYAFIGEFFTFWEVITLNFLDDCNSIQRIFEYIQIYIVMKVYVWWEGKRRESTTGDVLSYNNYFYSMNLHLLNFIVFRLIFQTRLKTAIAKQISSWTAKSTFKRENSLLFNLIKM